MGLVCSFYSSHRCYRYCRACRDVAEETLVAVVAVALVAVEEVLVEELR